MASILKINTIKNSENEKILNLHIYIIYKKTQKKCELNLE